MMNKKEFIMELSKRLGKDENTCLMINEVLEDNFLIGRKNKEKTIFCLMEKLEIDEKEADDIYNVSSSIITNAVKNKLKHPFKSQD